MCSINYQCSSITKQKCQCKNRVTDEGGFCTRHSKKESNVNQIQPINSSINLTNCFNNLTIQPTNTVISENTQEYTIPENIYVNGKFIHNVNNVKVPRFIYRTPRGISGGF
jgi:hypothetical protein